MKWHHRHRYYLLQKCQCDNNYEYDAISTWNINRAHYIVNESCFVTQFFPFHRTIYMYWCMQIFSHFLFIISLLPLFLIFLFIYIYTARCRDGIIVVDSDLDVWLMYIFPPFSLFSLSVFCINLPSSPSSLHIHPQ
jgi:hypothetical protein